MTERIKNMYRRAGLRPPKGRGLHTERAHKQVIRYRKQGFSTQEAWKRVVGGMGRHAIKAGHRRQRTYKAQARRRK